MNWSYGIISCKQRIHTLLVKTLKELNKAGFDNPRIFLDGVLPSEISHFLKEDRYSITTRSPKVGAFGNWILALWELWIRHPKAERYALFEDDFVTYKNLRVYLETIPLNNNEYWNLYTFPVNQKLCPRGEDKSKELVGFYPSNQMGLGAVALVFPKQAVEEILSNKRHIVTKPRHSVNSDRRHDGSIVELLTQKGFKELVHNPSLVQHQGMESTIQDKNKNWAAQLSLSFRGVNFDALELLNEK